MINKKIDNQSWAVSELGSADLGDKRLNKRLITLADDLSKAPLAPINQACHDCNSSKAAYRFFKNKRIDSEAIIKPHIESTVNRMHNHNVVLAIQDTTMIDYTSKKKVKGLGSIGGGSNTRNAKGLIMHATLAWSSQNLPLGFITQEIVTRSPQEKDNDYRKLPTEDKESYKWIDALEKTVKRTPDDCNVITICDREGDFFDMYLAAKDLSTHVVIRSSYNRKVEIDGQKELSLSYISTMPVASTCELLVPLKKQKLKSRGDGSSRKTSVTVVDEEGNRKRTAIIEIKYFQGMFLPPDGPGQIIKEKIPLSMVQVKEIDPPEGYESIEWNLLTTFEISSISEAIALIKIYKCRWRIETYFKILKSGCRIEDCRLGDAGRLKNFVSLCSVIAWRIYWLTFFNHFDPNAPATNVLSENELKTLYMAIFKKAELPLKCPNVSEAIVWIARLGGFLARKNDGLPGPTVLWRGWTRLQDMCFMADLINSS